MSVEEMMSLVQISHGVCVWYVSVCVYQCMCVCDCVCVFLLDQKLRE